MANRAILKLATGVAFVALAFSFLHVPCAAMAETGALAGYWNFDEGSGNVLNDISGSGNDGTIHAASWAQGKYDNGLRFNGLGDWVSVPSNPNLVGFSQMTLEAWIKLDSFQDAGAITGIINKGDGNWGYPNQEYSLGLMGGTIFFHVSPPDGTPLGFSPLVNAYAEGKIVETGRWYHIAAVWAGSNYSIFVDGVQVSSGSARPLAAQTSSKDLEIGRFGDSSVDFNYFHGTIDEVRIYGYARNEQQIQDDYSGEQPPISTSFPTEVFHFLAATLAITGVGAGAWILVRKRKKPLFTEPLATPTLKSPTIPMTAEAAVPTGYQPLDKLLYGGIPANSAVALTSPSCDDRDVIIRNFLEIGAKNSEVTFYVATNPGSAINLVKQSPPNFHLFLCNPQAGALISGSSNATIIIGLESLTAISIALTKTIKSLDSSVTGHKRLCIGLISDAMLFNGTIQTRRWLTELIPEMKLYGFTTLALIDPQMHPSQDLYTVLSLFDGEINIHERQTKKRQWFLKVNRMSNKKYIGDETLLP